MMAEERILNKIKKCLALSKSPNEHEAAAALRQAQKLMAAYGVTPEGLAEFEAKEARAKAASWSKPPMWEYYLADTVASAFGCKQVFAPGGWARDSDGRCQCLRNGSPKRNLGEFRYVGWGPNAELAVYAFNVLQRSIAKAREAHLAERWDLLSRSDKIRAGESFCLAYVHAVKSKLQDLALEPEQSAAVERKFLALYPQREIAKTAEREWDRFAGAAGAAAGQRQSLHRPMNKGEDPLQLKG